MHLSKLAVASTLLFTVVSSHAGAAVIEASAVIDFTQVGSNVVVTASGEVDLNSLEFFVTYTAPTEVVPVKGTVLIGTPPSGPVGIFLGISGPTSLGSGGTTFASSGSGGSFGIVTSFGIVSGNALIVPVDYVSGTSLSSSSTFDGYTFASLGLTPGTYVYTYGDPDTVTINVGVPEPSTWAMMLLGFAGLGYAGYRKAKTARATVAV